MVLPNTMTDVNKLIRDGVAGIGKDGKIQFTDEWFHSTVNKLAEEGYFRIEQDPNNPNDPKIYPDIDKIKAEIERHKWKGKKKK
jgi:hypothetical protein